MARKVANAWWTWGKRALVVAFAVGSGFLLYNTLSTYEPGEITQSVKKVPLSRVLLAGVFAAGSYFCLTWFDWLALRYAGKPLSYRRAALASFVSLSISHSIGVAPLSSGPLRYRFYSRYGVGVGDLAKIILFCGVTVFLGMITLGGIALLLHGDIGARFTGLTLPLAREAGAVCLAVAAGYVVLAALLRRPLVIRNWSIRLPEPKLAAAQILVGSINYVFVSACLHQTLASVADVSYFSVAAVFVLANGLALIAHVPGGLGVIEGVVTFLVPGGGVIGAVLMFRVIYFLVPLCIGAILLPVTELYFRKKNRRRNKR